MTRQEAVTLAQVAAKMNQARTRCELTTREMLDNFKLLGPDEIAEYVQAIEKCRSDWKVWSQVFVALNPKGGER